MVADTQAIDLLQELENRNVGLVDNQGVADTGVADTSALLGARPGEESITFDQLLSALPQPSEALEDTQTPTTDPILGMDLS